MSRYDEDLLENPFYLTLQNQHKELYDSATLNRSIICTPRYSTLSNQTFIEVDFQDHILKPHANSDTQFKTLSDKIVLIEDGLVKTREGFSVFQEVSVLFEETFYNNHDESYRVICIGRLLTSDKDVTVDNEEIPQSPTTFEECTALLWGHSGGHKMQESLDKALATFLHAYDRLQGESLRNIMDAAVAQFTKAMQIVLKNPTVRRSAKLSIPYMDNLKIAVETYVMHSLHKKLFRAITSCVATQDSELNKITRNLSELQLKDMGIRQQFSANIPPAKRELSKLNRYSTPLGKLFCIKRVVAALTKPSKQASTDDKDDLMTTDDFLPILIFLVVKSEVPNWMANLVYMKNFHLSKSSNNDEYGYYLASIEAALEHIETGQLKELVTGPEAAKAEKWMQLSMHVSGEGLARQDSNTPTDGSSSIEVLFQYIRLGDEDSVKNLLSRKDKLNDEIHLKLCHPLCSCDKCEKLQAQSRSETMLATTFSRDDRGYTALHVAAAYGQAGMIDVLVHRRAVVNATDYMGSNPLHLACQKGLQNVVLLLLHFRADPSFTDNDGNTPLHLSAANGHEDCVKALLFFDAAIQLIDVNATNDMGDTPLHLAAKWGYEKIVESLLENSARTDIRNRKKQNPMACAHNSRVQCLLQLAEEESDYFKIQKLSIKARVPKNAPSKHVNGEAGRSGGGKMVDVPKSKGVDTVTLQSSGNKNVERLLKAVKANDMELVKYYLGWTDESEEEDIDFNQPLCHPLCQCDKCQPIQKHNSRSSGVEMNSQTAEGWTPLHMATMYGHADLVNLFINRGANLGRQTNKQQTALHLAAEQGHAKIASTLVENGAKQNVRDFLGSTPLLSAVVLGFAEVTQILLQKGANCNQANFKGNTPLHEAVATSNLEAVNVLIEAGAIIDVTNKKKLTPLQLASEKTIHQVLTKHLHQSVPVSPPQSPMEQPGECKDRTGSFTSQLSIKDLFAAFEEKDLKTLKALGESIKNFNRRHSLKQTMMRDFSAPNLNQLAHTLSIQHFDAHALKHVDPWDRSDPLLWLSSGCLVEHTYGDAEFDDVFSANMDQSSHGADALLPFGIADKEEGLVHDVNSQVDNIAEQSELKSDNGVLTLNLDKLIGGEDALLPSGNADRQERLMHDGNSSADNAAKHTEIENCESVATAESDVGSPLPSGIANSKEVLTHIGISGAENALLQTELKTEDLVTAVKYEEAELSSGIESSIKELLHDAISQVTSASELPSTARIDQSGDSERAILSSSNTNTGDELEHDGIETEDVQMLNKMQHINDNNRHVNETSQKIEVASLESGVSVSEMCSVLSDIHITNSTGSSEFEIVNSQEVNNS